MKPSEFLAGWPAQIVARPRMGLPGRGLILSGEKFGTLQFVLDLA